MTLRALALLGALLCTTLVGACGSDDLHDAGERAQKRFEKAQKDVREARDRLRARVREVLGQLEQAIPQATRTDPDGRARGQTSATTIDGFMTRVLRNVDAYWTTTLTRAGHPAPRVSYAWVPPGRSVATGCGTPAGADAAFYCPSDDTIYFSQQFAAELYAGVVRGLPGTNAGYGHAAGDFSVAYVIAHEYAHNVQTELGLFSTTRTRSAMPFELQADCMAGTWANSVYEQGLLEPGDLQEAVDTALAVGDFDTNSQQHHGTPRERAGALLTGYRSGDPSACRRYAPPTL